MHNRYRFNQDIRAKMILNNEIAKIEVMITDNEFEHIRLGDGEKIETHLARMKSKNIMAYNTVCKELGNKQIKNMVKYANYL